MYKMEELKRFLNSIDFEYDEELDNTTIEKVVLKILWYENKILSLHRKYNVIVI